MLQVINKSNGAPFNNEDESLLSAFAGQAVIALENARLLEQTDQELQQRQRAIHVAQLDRDLTTTLELESVLNLTWIGRCASMMAPPVPFCSLMRTRNLT
ncbi:MAG: hypothetical protein M5U34_02975 [Chloroflexi bacterium]|nr:hypothetical protein [Chloroflexota bacterium]